MRSDRRFPAWLLRRSYFKRVGRWLRHKPRTGMAAGDDAEAAAPSNVLRFPATPERSLWMPDLKRQDARSA